MTTEPFAPWRRYLTPAAIAIVTGLQGCGGGEGASAVATTNPQAAHAALMEQPHDYRLSGTSQGISFDATLTLRPGAEAQYQDRKFATTEITETMSANGQSLGSGTQTLWRDKATGETFFYAGSPTGNCGIVSSSSPLPTSATLGGSGAMYEADEYSNCASPDQARNRIATSRMDWAYKQVGGLGYLCLNGTNDVDAVTESDCVEVTDAKGTLGKHFRVVLKAADGTSLTMTN